MRIEQTTDRLVLRQPPFLISAFAVSALLVGLACVGMSVAFRSFSESDGSWILGVMFGVVAILVAPLIALFAVTITASFDLAADTVCIERQGLFDRSARTIRTIPLSSVEDVALESIDGDGSLVYRIALRLTGGTTVPLTVGYDNFEEPKRKAVEAIRRFLEHRHTLASSTYNA